jgi:hypothetical protein
MSGLLLNFEPAALLVDYRIQDEMKLYPARPTTR